MAYKFGKRSAGLLEPAADVVKDIMQEAIETAPFDFCILCVFRPEKKQNTAFRNKTSTKQWPDSIHNILPSWAVDAARYYPQNPHIRWENTIDFKVLFDHINKIADKYDVDVIWGADWDGDSDIYEHQLIDMPHMQFKKRKKKKNKEVS